jgi:hypothetical protein
MFNWKLPLALSTVVLLGACAGPGTQHGHKGDHAMHAQHHQHMQGMQGGHMQGMPGMQGMYEQMRQARTPEECQAIMEQHMRSRYPDRATQPGMATPQHMREMCLQHMQNRPGASTPPPTTPPAGTSPSAPTR